MAAKLPRLVSAALIALGVTAVASPARSGRPPTTAELDRYPWLDAGARVRPLAEAFPPPPGYRRVPVAEGEFGAWLRGLPLRPPGTPVRSHRGALILPGNDRRLAAVVELDVGERDLQQCADTIIRLHAEWLWASGRRDEIAYRFVSGELATWTRYAAGYRARFDGPGRRTVTWTRRAAADGSRATFQAYLRLVFGWASTLSLDRYARRVPRAELRPGDFFVIGGSPGHAVIVLDVAEDRAGRRVALIGQGFMPAQDLHLLRAPDGGPWFRLDGDAVATPFWRPFSWSALRRL
jgi:hypothetical protein